MNGFIGQLKLRAFSPEEVAASGGSRAIYQLLEDFSYHSDVFGLLTAPAGMITDFASIPRAAFSYLDPEDPVILFPSVIHDMIYSMKGVRPGLPDMTRKDADDVLREAMIVCGARRTQAAVVWGAVRLFGGSHWA